LTRHEASNLQISSVHPSTCQAKQTTNDQTTTNSERTPQPTKMSVLVGVFKAAFCPGGILLQISDVKNQAKRGHKNVAVFLALRLRLLMSLLLPRCDACEITGMSRFSAIRILEVSVPFFRVPRTLIFTPSQRSLDMLLHGIPAFADLSRIVFSLSCL
jgi:hypothetical protein